MRYDQYVTLVQRARQLISKQMERLSARAGQNVSVFGQDIAVHVDRQELEEPEEDAWEFVVYGVISGATTSYGPAVAGRFPRPGEAQDQQTLNDPVFVAETEVEVGDEPTKTVTYFVTTMTQAEIVRQPFNPELGVYRGGLKLTCLFYEDLLTSIIPVREFTLFVERTGDSVVISAPEPGKVYRLRITTAERL